MINKEKAIRDLQSAASNIGSKDAVLIIDDGNEVHIYGSGIMRSQMLILLLGVLNDGLKELPVEKQAIILKIIDDVC